MLGGVVLLFRKRLLALGRKFGLFKTEGEKADQKNLNEAKKDFEDMLKDRGVKLDRQF